MFLKSDWFLCDIMYYMQFLSSITFMEDWYLVWSFKVWIEQQKEF